MATNIKKYLLLAVILFVFASFLPAQSTGNLFEEEGDEIKISQQFFWSGGEYALQFEVIFERETDGEYGTFLREFTRSQFIVVSLPPGAYRYRVIPYDVLERPEEGTTWINFNVIPIPRQEKYEEPETEIEPEIEIVPEEVPEEEQAQSDSLKPVLFKAGAVFGTQLPIYGNDFSNYIFPVNAGLRVSVVFKIPLDIYIGPEVSGNIYQCGMLDKWDMFVFTLGVNLLAMKWLPNEKFGVGFRLGAVYPSLTPYGNLKLNLNDDFEDVFKDSSLNNYLYKDFYFGKLIPNTGASFYWLIKKHLLLEIGFDFMHIFNDVPSGYFKPMLGISWQF
jgi:hypothetical protein